MPRLLITALTPNSKRHDETCTANHRNNLFDYIELYNATDQPIHLKDYRIHLWRGITPKDEWKPVHNYAVIPASETMVIWAQNEDNRHLTVSDFNGYYGTSLIEGQNIVIYQGFLQHNQTRAIVLTTNTGHIEVGAYYNDGQFDAVSEMAVCYVPPESDSVWMRKKNKLSHPAPGTLSKDQYPVSQIQMPMQPPEIENLTDTVMQPGNTFQIKIRAKDKRHLRTVTLFYKTDPRDDLQSAELYTHPCDCYYVNIDPGRLGVAEEFTYYFHVSDGFHEVTTEVYHASLGDIETVFSLIVLPDTQLYASIYPDIFQAQIDWIVANKEKHNIKYVIHLGDIVDQQKLTYQWETASREMEKLEHAGIPYGILPGNHDARFEWGFGYEDYVQYFGENRFKHQPYYGESYENNRGHYDFISAGGTDFMIVYMGWRVRIEDVDWINRVVAQHPDRKVILVFHSFLKKDGTRNEMAEIIFDQVVKRHDNIIAIFNGHVSDSVHRYDVITNDDTAKPDRYVLQMLVDYQGQELGGGGFLRIMQFDAKEKTVTARTYSPYLDQNFCFDPVEYPDKDTFTVKLDF